MGSNTPQQTKATKGSHKGLPPCILAVRTNYQLLAQGTRSAAWSHAATPLAHSLTSHVHPQNRPPTNAQQPTGGLGYRGSDARAHTALARRTIRARTRIDAYSTHGGKVRRLNRRAPSAPSSCCRQCSPAPLLLPRSCCPASSSQLTAWPPRGQQLGAPRRGRPWPPPGGCWGCWGCLATRRWDSPHPVR